MKAKLKKEMKKRLRRLARKHGVEAATALVTGFLGGLADSKGSESEPEPVVNANGTTSTVDAHPEGSTSITSSAATTTTSRTCSSSAACTTTGRPSPNADYRARRSDPGSVHPSRTQDCSTHPLGRGPRPDPPLTVSA